jgi:hypothetical protein
MSTISVVYQTGGYSATMAIQGNYAYISSYVTSSYGNEGYINRINVDDPSTSTLWLNTGENCVMQMAVTNDYLYILAYNIVQGGSSILKISFDDTNDPPTVDTWYTNSESALMGIAVSDTYVYVSSLRSIMTLDINTAALVNTVSVSSYSKVLSQLAINGDYLYAGLNSGVARLGIGEDTTFTQGWWNVPYSTKSVTAYGDYIYAACKGANDTYYTIKQIPIADPGSYSTFDDTINGIYSIYTNGGDVYAPLPSVTYMFAPVVTETLVYSPNDLTSSDEKDTDKRGIAPLRRPGQRKPVGMIELTTRTIIGRHRRRTIYTSHNEFNITVFDKMSAISGRFMYVNRTGTLLEEVKCSALSGTGQYATANVSIKPKGNMREITVTGKSFM